MIGAAVAIQTKCLAQPLRQALHTAGRLEADGVQIDLRTELPLAELSDTGVRQLRKLLEDLNLRVGSAAFPTRRGYSTAAQLDQRLQATGQAMAMASRLGARTLVVNLGAAPDADTSAWSTLAESIAALAAMSNRFGVRLAAQCPGASHAEVERVVQEFPEGLLGLDLNPADLIHRRQSPSEFAQAFGRHIAHVFANDAVSGFGTGAVDVELGRGAADVPAVLGALEEHDYRGWITIERRGSARPVEDVADAVQFLRSL